jgi:phage terminase large subunit-like protein
VSQKQLSKKKINSWPPGWLTPVKKNDLLRSRGFECADFINTFCTQTKETIAGYSGEPIHLRDWQEEILNNLFAVKENGLFVHRTGLIGMPRKNGKSTLGSGLALWSLFMGPEGGEVYSCAADRDQARIVFGDAKRMIEAEPELAELCKVYKDAVEVSSTGSIYRVLSSEAFTKEGLSPTMVIYDELHAAPNRELFDVMQLGMGARREPMLVAITTAGVKADATGQDSIAYSLYQYGQKVARKEIDDPTFFMAWWEAKADANHHDAETWKEANPGFGDLNDPQDFESMVKKTPESEFRTKRCNQWVSSQQAWLPNGAWDGLALIKELSKDVEIVLGFDGSFSGDASVIVGTTLEEVPHVFIVKAWEKQVTDTDDWRVDTLEVENTIIEFCGKYKVREVACDPFRWQRSMQVLQDAGIPIVEWPSTSAARMIPACAKFYDAVVNQRLSHDGDPLLARHISNAVVKTDRLGPRIVKEHRGSPRKIDAAVASIIALDRATVAREQEIVSQPAFFMV